MQITQHIPNGLPMMKLRPTAILPTRAHPEDAGLDLYAEENAQIEPGQSVLAKTGIAVELPHGTVGMIADRSSMARKGFKTAGGIIDAGYRGEVMIVLWNISRETLRFERGERIAQMLILPICTPAVREQETLGDTKRGSGGFGSSGK